VVPLCLRKPLTYIGQVLENDNVAVVFSGFCDDLVGDSVDVLFAPRLFTLPETEESIVRGLRPTLLHLSPSFLELTAPVVVVVSVPEPPRGGNGETVDAEVDTKDCLVLGIFREVMWK
jgi:hypothetical protein